jgi:hypothetical protein
LINWNAVVSRTPFLFCLYQSGQRENVSTASCH